MLCIYLKLKFDNELPVINKFRDYLARVAGCTSKASLYLHILESLCTVHNGNFRCLPQYLPHLSLIQGIRRRRPFSSWFVSSVKGGLKNIVLPAAKCQYQW